jgi:hypothetical protein
MLEILFALVGVFYIILPIWQFSLLRQAIRFLRKAEESRAADQKILLKRIDALAAKLDALDVVE